MARGLLAAKEQFDVPVPIVIRLVGTNEKEARAMIAGNGMILADTLEEGAQKAVEVGRRA